MGVSKDQQGVGKDDFLEAWLVAFTPVLPLITMPVTRVVGPGLKPGPVRGLGSDTGLGFLVERTPGVVVDFREPVTHYSEAWAPVLRLEKGPMRKFPPPGVVCVRPAPTEETFAQAG
jgi:hypothetical protein